MSRLDCNIPAGGFQALDEAGRYACRLRCEDIACCRQVTAMYGPNLGHRRQHNDSLHAPVSIVPHSSYMAV